MIKAILIITISGVALTVAYVAGAYITAFGDNQCYSIAIADVAQEAKLALKDGTPSKAAEFDQFLTQLPLYGYESHCNSITSAIEQYRKARNAK